MEITKDVFEAANRRAATKKAGHPAVVSVKYSRHRGNIIINLSSGLILEFSPKDTQGLENARPVDLENAEITPSGLGVHFPRLDADLYIPGLLKGFLGTKRWIAAEIGRKGGRALTELKARAARRNGKLGGRPKKSKSLVPA